MANDARVFLRIAGASEKSSSPSMVFRDKRKEVHDAKYEAMRRNILLTPAQEKILAERVNALTNEEASIGLDYALGGIAKMDARNPRIVMAHILMAAAGIYGLISPEFKKVNGAGNGG